MKKIIVLFSTMLLLFMLGCLEENKPSSTTALNLTNAPYTYNETFNTSDIHELQKQLQFLYQENSELKQRLYELNLTLEHYKSELIAYQEKLRAATKEENFSLTSGYAELDAPAVRQKIEQEGEFPFIYTNLVTEGALLTVSVEIKEGKGRVMVVTNPLMGPIFQDAANTAVLVAENKTGVNLGNSDVIFSVNGSEVSEVDGPSAGGLMTVLLISAIESKQLNRSITMTGTIEQDSHIGAIGGVFEKAQAAKKAGKKLFLIPKENSVLTKWVETREERGLMTIVTKKAVPVDAKEYIEDKVGIKVEYVDNVDDALKYFIL